MVKSETKGRHDRKLLDLEFESYGARIIIEAKYNDCQAAAAAADSRLRLDPPPDAVGALSYSPEFEKMRRLRFRKTRRLSLPLRAATILAANGAGDAARFTIWRSRYAAHRRLPRHATTKSSERIDHIRGALALFAGAFGEKPAAAEKVAEVLQIKLAPENKDDQISDAVRAGGLILIGALMFQFRAWRKRSSRPFADDAFGGFRFSESLGVYFARNQLCCRFDVALRVLKAGNVGYREIKDLVDVAQNVFPTARDGVDLIGRIYHTLLSDAKTLAAFLHFHSGGHFDGWNLACARNVGRFGEVG